MAALRRLLTLFALAFVCVVVVPGGQAIPANVRLTNDDPAIPPGYVSDYTMVTGNPYTDDVLATCSRSRGRQNELGAGEEASVIVPGPDRIARVGRSHMRA